MMKRLFLGAAAALSLLGLSVATAPLASAYPEVVIDLSVDRSVLYGGEEFTATGTSNVDCAWDLEWNDVQRSGNGSDGSPFQTTYTAPVVQKVTKIPLHGVCTYTEPTSRSAAPGATWERTIIITVLPRGGATTPPDDGGLPGTGGPALIVLIGGLALLVGGTIVVRRSQRKAV